MSTLKSTILVPMIDLRMQHSTLVDEIQTAVRKLVLEGAFIGGSAVDTFESEWAAFCGVPHAVGVASGSDALRLALLASGIGPGDEVVTVPFTFSATLEAIRQIGAVPVLVDVDPVTATMDPEKIRARLSSKTKAILPVHLYGHPADMRSITAIARAHGLLIIEDSAQAHGATCEGRTAGAWGDAAAFSFYPTKNLGACGQAGAVTTGNAEIARQVRILRDHGQPEKNNHRVEGFNSKLDAIQAAVLSIKLQRLSNWNEARRSLASIYHQALSGIPGLVLPHEAPGVRAVYHLYVVRTPRRDELREKLAERGVATGLHYPKPLHLQGAFRSLGYAEGAFPDCEKWAKEVLSLPMYPELDPDAVRFVCEQIRAILR